MSKYNDGNVFVYIYIRMNLKLTCIISLYKLLVWWRYFQICTAVQCSADKFDHNKVRTALGKFRVSSLKLKPFHCIFNLKSKNSDGNTFIKFNGNFLISYCKFEMKLKSLRRESLLWKWCMAKFYNKNQWKQPIQYLSCLQLI